MDKEKGGGITFLGALQVLFIGLKLCGVIDWSWWQVLLPFLGPLVFCATLLVIAGVLRLIAGMLE